MGSLEAGDRMSMVVAEPQLQDDHHHHHHFLLVCFPIVSHVNPVLQLAKLLTRSGARVTFSTAVSRHRLMFPEEDAPPKYPLPDQLDPLLAYHPYSDGYDDGVDRAKHDVKDYMASQRTVGGESLHRILAAAVPPVTCVIYAIILPWVASVAAEAGVPSACFWIQPTTVFGIYYHYFHGHRDLIDAHSEEPSFVVNRLPGVPPVQVRDLPSFLGSRSVDDFHNLILLEFEELYRTLDRGGTVGGKKTKILVNSFNLLERVDTLATATELVEIIPIGPVLPPAILGGCCEKEEEEDLIVKTADHAKESYTEWLRRWPEKSVVYISFGSISVFGKKQKEEISKAMTEMRRPYLWVARDGKEGVLEGAEDDDMGLVVDWCSQVEVLPHPSVGCFVTHCGWNSTLESLASGVPMVCHPQWSDQRTNAWLVEEVWGVGVRAATDAEGVIEAGELTRCLDFVMGEDGVDIRNKAQMWREKAREAVEEGGSSDTNLKEFLKNLESQV